MNLTQVAAPAKLPLDLAVVREHIKVLDAGGDDLITGYIQAAAEYVGGRYGILGRALITQTWDLNLCFFPKYSNVIKLPFPPLKQVVSIKYFDSDGAEQTLSALDYSAASGDFLARVKLKDGLDWPSDLSSDEYPITIQFIVGFGDNSADIPMPIRQAMLLLIGHWYENRSEVEACELTQMPMASTALLSPYKVTELML